MIRYIADVGPCTSELESELRDGLSPAGFVVLADGDHLQIGLYDGAAPLKLTAIKLLMTSLARQNMGPASRLTWRFSGQSVATSDLSKLVEAWDHDSEVPLLSVIRLDLGDCKHRTHGLAAFIGHECAAHFDSPNDARIAAANLALLARHALIEGRLERRRQFVGLDGHLLSMVWPDPADVSATVKIIFSSVRNGLGSD